MPSCLSNNILIDFGDHFGVGSASFDEKRFRTWFQKGDPQTLKQVPIDMSKGFQRGGLACALFKQETKAQAQIPRIAARDGVFGAEMLFGLVSMSKFRQTYLNTLLMI